MKKKLLAATALTALLNFPSLGAGADGPIIQLRLRTPDTQSDETWASTFGIIRKNPGCCDEVWFSTGIGYPPLAVHAERARRMVRAAEDLRRIGVVPSLQIQATIGHSDEIGALEDCSAKDWTGWTSSTGFADRVCSCPRDPRFLAYFREVSKLYAAFTPGSVWIDDDLRCDGHMPASAHRDPRPGCWCDRCIADFNRETGGAWTRETLLRAVGTDDALLAKWKSFCVGSLVGVARTIAGAFHETSPATTMGLQLSTLQGEVAIRRILEGLHAESGLPVGYRPGGDAYYDDNPNEQVRKSMRAGRFRRTIGDPPWVKTWTPEIESWPRVYGSRSAQATLIEGFAALMYGMNAMSMLVIQTGNEQPSLYSKRVLAPIAKAAPFLKGYARACVESTAVGFGTDGDIDAALRFAATGIPLNVGVGRVEGNVSGEELETDYHQETTLRIQELRDALDRRAGGSPAVLESPFVGHMMPRVSSNGMLRLVSFINVRIEEQGPLALRLRYVPAGQKSVIWREMNRAPVVLPLVRTGGVVRVTVPSISAWNAGWLDFQSVPNLEFAEWGALSPDVEMMVRTEAGSPFAFIDVAPKAAMTNARPRRIDLPSLTLRPFAAKPKAMSYAGLTEVDGHTGAIGYLAVAEPFTRRGVVIGWLTNDRASGVIASGFDAEGRVVLRPFAEYGRMLVKAGTKVAPDTLVVGWFDDCRLGLEAYADLLAKTHGVKLPRQIAGYTTWYPDRFGYSDRSRYPQGCGAGDEESTKAFADEVKRLGLDKYGFRFFQCDDQWQCGKEYDGPARDFEHVNPKGPYPHGLRVVTDYLRERGIITGLWWMPFCGVSWDPAWTGRSNLFARAFANTPAAGSTVTQASAKEQKAGMPFETHWADTCLDMTNPDARAYVAAMTRRITYDWGMDYIKFDGIWTGYVGDLLGGKSWKNDHLDNVVFADETASNMSAFRQGLQTQREAAKPGTFILGCNLAQSSRALVPSVGFVDAMRIGGDNGPIDMFPDRYRKGPESATVNYFLNGRVWYNDPDPVYVRNVVPLGRARTFASFTALAGALYNFSDWLPDLKPERVEILKRTLAPHGILSARPIDYFESALPNAWVLEKDGVRVFGLYNWNTNEAMRVDYPAAYAGLDPAKTYAGFDFWADRFVPAFKGRLSADVAADDCRVIAVREFDGTKPVVVSTSRHVASPAFDVADEKWDAAAKTLSGTSRVVPGESYELRIAVPQGLRCVSANGGRIVQRDHEARITFEVDRAAMDWQLAFE